MIEYLNPQGINTFQNPLQVDGQMIHGVNVVQFPSGGMSKRPGYTTFLNNPDGSVVNSLFIWQFQNSGTFYAYRASGSQLYSSFMGTGNFTPTTGGSISPGQHVGYTIFNNVLTVGDGVNPLLNSVNGTTFTSPGSAPVAQYLTTFQDRVYTTDGTSGNLQYSTANDPTNWQDSGTSDSSFLLIPTDGALGNLFVAANYLNITQTRGNMYNWDGTTLTNMATTYGPSSPWSIAQIDDVFFWTNNVGQFQYDGAQKTVISNPIQRQFYNRQNTGISSTSWGTMPSTGYIWQYLTAVGTFTDDFTGRTVTNGVIAYDFQKTQYLNWSFNDPPTALYSYVDVNLKRQLIFGNAAGQCFQLNTNATSDNGNPIPTEMVYVFDYAQQSTGFNQTSASMVSGSTYEKLWKSIRLFFQPGDEMNIQFAFSNSLTYQNLTWSEVINTKIGDGNYWHIEDGAVEIAFPINQNNLPRSRFLFIRMYESSTTSAWSYYGASIVAEPQIQVR